MPPNQALQQGMGRCRACTAVVWKCVEGKDDSTCHMNRGGGLALFDITLLWTRCKDNPRLLGKDKRKHAIFLGNPLSSFALIVLIVVPRRKAMARSEVFSTKLRKIFTAASRHFSLRSLPGIWAGWGGELKNYKRALSHHKERASNFASNRIFRFATLLFDLFLDKDDEEIIHATEPLARRSFIRFRRGFSSASMTASMMSVARLSSGYSLGCGRPQIISGHRRRISRLWCRSQPNLQTQQ